MLVQEFWLQGLPNAMVLQHLVLGVFAYLLIDFGGLLEKHLFLGRTLLLRLQNCFCGSRATKFVGMVVPGLANVVLVQHLVLGTVPLRLWACQAMVVRLVGWLVGWLVGSLDG